MKNKKWNIGWGVVSSCNMKCEFCYSRFQRIENNDLSLKDWIRFVDENHEYINSINYGTGENSLNSDWFQLIDYIRRNYGEIKQSLTTNGYISEVIKNDITKLEIVNRAIDEFDISLDFADLERHNEFRGQNQAGKWVLNTLNYCKEYGKETTIVCLGSRKNMYTENIEGLFSIAASYLSKIRINIYRPTEGINKFSTDFIWKPREIVKMLYSISEKHGILAISDVFFSNLLTDREEKDPSGINSIRILPNGNISPSTYLIKDIYTIGNIKKRNILSILDQSNQLSQIVFEKIPNTCNDCIHKRKCKGGGLDRRYLWYGTLDKKDPYCVFSKNEIENIKKIKLRKKEIKSVHYGYLPTLFFEP